MNPQLLIILIVFPLVFAISSNADENCADIEKAYRTKGNSLALTTKAELANDFILEKQFTSGAGGASVYLVKDNNDNKKKVLKIFPAENFSKDFKSNMEIREVYLSCRLAQLNFEKDDKRITFRSQGDFNYFPGYYRFGYADTDKPFDKGDKVSNKKHLYIVMEFIEGKDLFSHSRSEDIATAPFASKKINATQVAKVILFQIAQALKKANEELGFLHRDLHPGNIMLASQDISKIPSPKKVDFNVLGGGRISAPMVKIIDFGLATSDDFPDDKKGVTEPSRSFSKVLLEFGRNLSTDKLAAPKFLAEASSVSRQFNKGDDLQFINMIIYSLRNYFGGAFMDYCRTYEDCMDKLSPEKK